MTDPISIIARRLTGLVARNCCHRTGGQGTEPCECREMAALILADLILDERSRADAIRLAAGEMTAQEMRTVQAVLGWVRSKIAVLPEPPRSA